MAKPRLAGTGATHTSLSAFVMAAYREGKTLGEELGYLKAAREMRVVRTRARRGAAALRKLRGIGSVREDRPGRHPAVSELHPA